MKHLNFLSKSSSQSCGHSSVTLASTVGSPSVHRRSTMLRLLSVLVLVLTFGVGNAWGATAAVNSQAPANGKSFIIALYYNSTYYALPHISTAGTHPGKACTLNGSNKVTAIADCDSPNDCLWDFTSATGGFTISYTSGVTTNYLWKTGQSGNNQNISTKTTTGDNIWAFTEGSANNVKTYSVQTTKSSATAHNVLHGNSGSTFQVRGTTAVYAITLLEVAPSVAYTVTLKDDNSTRTEASPGAGVTLPSRSGCDGYTFAGWTASWTSAQTSWTTTAPTIIPAGAYAPSANVNLYPVYTKETPSGTKSYAVTTTLTVGKTYVFGAVKAAANANLANNTTFGAVAFTNTYNSTTGGTWGAKVDLTPNTSGVLTGNDTTNLTAACKWVLQSVTSGNYTFKNGNKYLCLGTSTGSTSSAQCGVATTAGNFYLENVNNTCKDAFLCHPTSNSTNIMLYNTSNGYRMYASRAYSNTMTPYVRFYEYNPGVTISYISVPNCCTSLGQINGSISWSNGTSATLSWANDGNVSSYSVTCKQGETNKGTVGGITGTTTKSCTVTELTAGQTYTFTINASGDATHCDASQVISATAPKITATADLGDFGYAQGSNPEEQSFTVSGTALTGSLTVKAPANYLIKVGTGEWSAAGGEKSITVSTPPSNLSSTTIYVKAATDLNEGDNPSGNIEITGGGAAQVEVAVSATITSACAVNPTIGAATLKAGGAFGLDGVAVSVTGMNPGTNCTWTDYGFYWGTVDNKKAHKVEIGNSGNATSFETTLAFTAPAQFAAGTTYYFCAYGKNAKSGAEIICGTEASFTPYTVSYNANGGSGEVATVVVNAGGSVTLPSATAFTLNCNDMTKWALNSTSGTQYNPEGAYSNINANAEFYAIWNTRTYTVQYAAGTTPANGGAITGSHANDTKTCGVNLTLPGVTFSSTGYTQDGWAKADGGNKTNNLSGSYSSNQAQIFYPHWLINTYNVTKGTKTGCSGNDFTVAATVDHYGSITVTASPDNAHKGSAQVSVSPSGNATVSGTTISNIIGDIEVSVSFSAKETASIILHDAGGQSTVSGTHYEMDNYTLPNTAAACTESEFYGWYTEAYSSESTAPSGDKYIAKNASKALVAGENHFYAVYATITPDAADTYSKITSTSELVTGDYLIVGTPGTTMYAMQNAYFTNESSMADESRTVNNNQISNPANTKADYIWRITRSNNNVTIYSAGNSKYFGISVGHVSLQDAADNFTFDASDGKWAFTAGSYHLKYDSYFKAGDTKVYQAYLFKRDALVAAPYTTSPSCTTHDLTSVVDPSSPAGGTVELGKTTVLETKTTTATATPSDHYTFSHWTISGAGASLENADGEGKSTDNPVEVTMGTADATITAHFTEKPKCTVEFYNNGGSAISSTTYWLGETPTAPTLTDGHVDAGGNACDETSTTHYGWTQTVWSQTITQSDVDAKTAANVKVYTKAEGVPAIEAGDNGKTIKYYAVWAHAENSSVQKNYTLSISYSDCPTSYDSSLPTKNAEEVNGTGTVSVSFGGTGVMNQASQIQFRKSSKGAGYIYNTVDLGSITSITTNNDNLRYYIGSSENPSSGTSGGYFKIYNNSDNTLNPSGITVNFTKSVDGVAYSAFLTNCCEELAAINGEVEFTDPTTAVVTWDKLENVAASSAYAVSYRTGSDAYGTTNVSAVDLTGSKATCTITGLSCNTNYDFKIAVTAATGYCDKEQVIAGQNSGKYAITLNGNGTVTGGTFEADAADACGGATITLSASKSAGYNFNSWAISDGNNITADVLKDGYAATDDIVEITMPAKDITVNASFSTISYDITYENMEGATNHANNPASYTVEDAISLGDPTKEGYNFGGWFTDGDLAAGHEAGSPAIAAGSTGNKTFYAKWIADDKWSVAITAPSHGTITVSWNGGENSFSSESQNIEKNTDITITATPSDGYQLTSLKIGDADDFTSGSVHKLIASIVISATFTPITYTITYNNMEGATNHEDNVANYTIEAAEDVLLNDASKTGYTFDGWFTDNGTWENQIMWIDKGSTGNVVVYAKWTAKESTITWNAHGGSVSPTSSKYTYDGSTVELPIPTRDHYNFDGWFTEAEGGTKITEIGTENKPVADVIYHAHWTEITYTVKWSVNGDDTYAEGEPTTSVTYNSKVTTLPTAPTSAECDDAKKFVGWRAEKISGTSASAPDGIFTDIEHSPQITDDVTFYAVFATETIGDIVLIKDIDDLADGDKVYIYSEFEASETTYGAVAKAYESGNNVRATSGTVANEKLTPSTGACAYTFGKVKVSNTDYYTFNDGTYYLYSSNTSKNYLQGETDLDNNDYGLFTVEINGTTGVATIRSKGNTSRSYMQFNKNNDTGDYENALFACYQTASQTSVKLFKKNPDVYSDYVTTCASCDDDATFTTALPAISAEDCTSATVTATGGLATLGSEGCNISDYGFVLGTATNPVLNGEGVTKLQVGTSNPTVGEDFSYDMTGLTKGTHYYVRAYAINKHGVAYSSTQDFWTKNVSSIAITTAPTKTNYVLGESFDATGMVVTATLADGSEVDVTAACTYSPSAFNMAGTNLDFAINYSLCETAKQVNQQINVYGVTVSEDPSTEDKGNMAYDAAGTITISNLASHTTVEFEKENADIRDNGDGTFSIINPTGTVSITVKYVTASQVAVKFFANGTELEGLALSPYQSENFDMPAASAVANAMTVAGVTVSEDVHFVGWSASNFPYQTSEPTMVAETGKVTAATNYYAVFSNIQKVRIDEGVIAGSYQSSETEVSAGEFTNGFVHKQVMASGAKLQFKKDASSYGYVYNKAALAYINKIVIGYAAANTFRSDIDVYACSDKKTITGSILVAEERGNTDPYVYRFPDNISYFWVKGDNFYTYVVDYIDIYYAEGTGYYTTQFSTLTFNKADGTVDKTIQKATNDTYALTNADVPSENDTPEGYTFLNKWFDGTDTYAKDAVVTLSSDIVLKPCWDIEINGDVTVPAANVVASDITVNEGKTLTLTLTGDTKLGDIFVENGGTLTISGDKKVDAKDFYIEAQEGYSGQVKGNGTIAVYGNAYYDLTLNPSGTMDNSKWYAFAVPFQVDAATGIQRLSNDGVTANAGFNSHYRIKKYDTAKRLSTGKGWVDVTSGETLYPGHFYMISLNSNVYNRLRMTKKAGTNLSNIGAIDLVTNGTGTDANWNALANNALAYVNLSATGANEGIKVQTYRNTTDPDGYDLFDFVEITLTVGTPFFVQAVASAEDGLNVAVAATNNETVKAPAREAVATEEFQLRLGANAESYYDKLYVSASEEALNEYQIGHDLQKAGVSTTVPQMYVPAYGTKLCDAEFPLVNNEATFPLTITAPNAGTYQLYVAKAAVDADLYLTYEGAIIWNLSMGAYEIELAKGTTNGYGLLLQAKAPQVVTGVDQLDNGDWTLENVQKVIIDEHVFILRDGQMYDVTGKMVK